MPHTAALARHTPKRFALAVRCCWRLQWIREPPAAAAPRSLDAGPRSDLAVGNRAGRAAAQRLRQSRARHARRWEGLTRFVTESPHSTGQQRSGAGDPRPRSWVGGIITAPARCEAHTSPRFSYTLSPRPPGSSESIRRRNCQAVYAAIAQPGTATLPEDLTVATASV